MSLSRTIFCILLSGCSITNYDSRSDYYVVTSVTRTEANISVECDKILVIKKQPVIDPRELDNVKQNDYKTLFYKALEYIAALKQHNTELQAALEELQKRNCR